MNFVTKNLIIYFLNGLSIICTYFFIILCFNYLSSLEFTQFTGFISILNILLTPLAAISLGISRIPLDKLNNEIKEILRLAYFFIGLSLIIFYFTLKIYNIENYLQIEIKYFFFIFLIFFFSLYQSIELGVLAQKRQPIKQALVALIPFIAKLFFLILTINLAHNLSLNKIILIHIISVIFFYKNKYLFLKKNFFLSSIKVNNFFMSQNFLNNFFTLIIFSILLNVDILFIRYWNLLDSNNYYISSLYAKIIFFFSSFIVPFTYKLKKSQNIECIKILILNIIISLLILIIYFYFFNYLNSILLPNKATDTNLVLRIGYFILLLSISNILTSRLNTLTNFHLKIKSILILFFFIFFYLLIEIKDPEVLIINTFTLLSFLFVLIDLFFIWIFFYKKL
jgi:hypothetical protein